MTHAPTLQTNWSTSVNSKLTAEDAAVSGTGLMRSASERVRCLPWASISCSLMTSETTSAAVPSNAGAGTAILTAPTKTRVALTRRVTALMATTLLRTRTTCPVRAPTKMTYHPLKTKATATKVTREMRATKVTKETREMKAMKIILLPTRATKVMKAMKILLLPTKVMRVMMKFSHPLLTKETRETMKMRPMIEHRSGPDKLELSNLNSSKILTLLLAQ